MKFTTELNDNKANSGEGRWRKCCGTHAKGLNTIENDNSGYGIFGQRFSANGTPLGLEFLVNSETDSDQENPSIAMDADGNFVVVWQSDGNTAEDENKDDSGYGVFGQRFSANGVKAGFEFRVNTKTDFDQDNPDVAMDANGDFVVVWQSDEQDGDDAGLRRDAGRQLGRRHRRARPGAHRDAAHAGFLG